MKKLLTTRIAVKAAVATTACICTTTAALTPTKAATFRVLNNTVDAPDKNPGDGICEAIFFGCTLRAAVQESNAFSGRDVIEVIPGIFELMNSGLAITESVDITGAGADATIIDGNNSFLTSLFIDNDADTKPIVNIFGVTIRNFNSGAIFVDEGTSLSLSNSLVTENGFLTGGVIQNRGFLQLSNSTISNNRGGARGGGFANSGTLKLLNSTVSGNTSRIGAGIQNFSRGRLEVVNSTISGNTAEVSGGGILNIGNAFIAYSTITHNAANGRNEDFEATAVGGGIHNIQGGRVQIGNTILAGNTDNREDTLDSNYSPDCFSTARFGLTSFRGNLVGIANSNCNIRDTIFGDTRFDQVGTADEPIDIDTRLAPLDNNGGTALFITPPKTHALLPGSLAIDKGDGITSSRFFDCPSTDQRGAPRPFDGNGDGNAVCDVGAFEFGTQIPTQDEPPASVPEPTSIFALLGLGALGVGSTLKKK
ncbi:MAG: PEP-CTERM sorting domain-containing protein [Symploca sp. SIO1A3]|nr:PEP-CTERM sorting domain-containing protein [Symploca sp. SIO1A3]